MRRPVLAAVVVIVGLLLLADFLIVNQALAEIADVVLAAVILAAAGAALAAVGSLGLRRGRDLWERRGDPIGALLVLAGMGAVLVAGLRPGADGATDPAVVWIVAALLVPIGATLFGLLFVTTLGAARRSLDARGRDTALLLLPAAATIVLLLPLGGQVGDWLAGAAGWTLAGPVAAVFRGLLLGIAVLAAVVAARTMLGIGAADE